MMQDNIWQSSQCEEGLFEDLGRLRKGLGFRVNPNMYVGYLPSPTPQKDLNTCLSSTWQCPRHFPRRTRAPLLRDLGCRV